MVLTDVFSYPPKFSMDPIPTRPWRTGPWVWASQGHLIVALADDGREADALPERLAKAVHYLDDASTAAQDVSLPALRKFAGTVAPGKVRCRDCHGSGRSEFGELIECEHCHQSTRQVCPACDGEGTIVPPINVGRVAGVVINRTVLAFALSLVPSGETASLGPMNVGRSDGSCALLVQGDGWRIVLMSCRGIDEPIPSFPAQANGEPGAVDAVDPVGERVTG